MVAQGTLLPISAYPVIVVLKRTADICKGQQGLSCLNADRLHIM